MQSCKRGKACGIDNVFYEHYILAGNVIVNVLKQFYTALLKLSYVPPKMIKGVIITLHKGGKKRKDDPNNYKAITLTLTILKLYEHILLLRTFKNT